MEFTVQRKDDHFQFRIQQVPEKYHPSLKESYYQQEGDTFFKSYSATIPHIQTIGENFIKNGQSMLDQLAGLAPVPWEDALSFFAERMKDTGVEWLLVGSLNLLVRGIEVTPRDVDVICYLKDMEKVQSLFGDVVMEPLQGCDNWVAKAYGALFHKALISIAFDTLDCLDQTEPTDAGPYAMAHAETVIWKGYSLRVPPLELSVNINRRRGRLDRVELIEDYLKKA